MVRINHPKVGNRGPEKPNVIPAVSAPQPPAQHISTLKTLVRAPYCLKHSRLAGYSPSAKEKSSSLRASKHQHHQSSSPLPSAKSVPSPAQDFLFLFCLNFPAPHKTFVSSLLEQSPFFRAPDNACSILLSRKKLLIFNYKLLISLSLSHSSFLMSFTCGIQS